MRTLRALVTVAATAGVLLTTGLGADARAATTEGVVRVDPVGFATCTMHYERDQQSCYYAQTTGGQECDYLLYDCSPYKK